MSNEALKQKVDLLAIAVNKLVCNDSLTEHEAYSLANIAYIAERNVKEYKETQRAHNKILQLEMELSVLYQDYPQFKNASN